MKVIEATKPPCPTTIADIPIGECFRMPGSSPIYMRVERMHNV